MYLAHTPSPPSAEGGGSSAERMVEEPLSLCGNALLNRKAIYRGSSLGKMPHKASPERGGARRRRAEGFVSCSSTPRVHGGSVSRRGLTQLQQRTHPPLRRNQARRNNNPKRQLLFGREGSGGRGGFSERSPSPPRPLSPEERLGFELSLSSGYSPLKVGRGFLQVGCGHGG